MRSDPNKADEIIRSTLFDLGKKHSNYGATTFRMEVVGDIFRAGFMQVIPQDGMEQEKYERISHAFIIFLKVIVYWLQLGLESVQQRDCMF